MTSPRTKNFALLTTAIATAALLVSGCGAGDATRTQSSGAPAAGSSPQAQTPPASGKGSGERTQASPGASLPAAPSPPEAPSAALPCKAAALTGSTEVTGAAAGSVYLQLTLTNSGAEPCMLQGFPGVSLTAAPTGGPIGAPADRDASSPVTAAVLAPGQGGTATLRYTQAGNYLGCTRAQAAGFRIYPPDDTASLFVADPRDACSNPEIRLLTIGAFQPR